MFVLCTYYTGKCWRLILVIGYAVNTSEFGLDIEDYLVGEQSDTINYMWGV